MKSQLGILEQLRYLLLIFLSYAEGLKVGNGRHTDMRERVPLIPLHTSLTHLRVTWRYNSVGRLLLVRPYLCVVGLRNTWAGGRKNFKRAALKGGMQLLNGERERESLGCSGEKI